MSEKKKSTMDNLRGLVDIVKELDNISKNVKEMKKETSGLVGKVKENITSFNEDNKADKEVSKTENVDKPTKEIKTSVKKIEKVIDAKKVEKTSKNKEADKTKKDKLTKVSDKKLDAKKVVKAKKEEVKETTVKADSKVKAESKANNSKSKVNKTSTKAKTKTNVEKSTKKVVKSKNSTEEKIVSKDPTLESKGQKDLDAIAAAQARARAIEERLNRYYKENGRERDNNKNNRNNNQNNRKPNFNRNAKNGRPQDNNRQNNNNNNNTRSNDRKPRQTAKPSIPSTIAGRANAKPGKQFGNKNKSKQKDGEKKTMNRRTLIRRGFIVENDYETRMGSRRKARKKQNNNKQLIEQIKIVHAIVDTDIVPIKMLSEKIGVTAAEIVKKLFSEGIMKTVNESIDFDMAEYIAAMYDITLEYKPAETAEDVLAKDIEIVDNEEDLVSRPPVVTFMGHVDHGKTSLLDAIKDSHVTNTEAGGITQSIGAYSVSLNGKKITFVDTPGHEAFTSMRQRGAQITDIAVLVVAADDGVMPQTVEAINHIKAAGVEMIVAINKIDRPNANIDKVKQELVEHEVLSEDWGGTTIMVPVSAQTREGIENLLESILLDAEILELKANPARKAVGIVVEAKLDKGKGPMATILIQNGTLKVGDTVISGFATGRIRAMTDDKGRAIKEAGPSMAVSVLGLSEPPEAGDKLMAVDSDKISRAVLQEREKHRREEMLKNQQVVSLEDVFAKLQEGKLQGLNLIIKADVQGSVEAVKQSMQKLSNDEVKVKIIHAAVGAINESDVMLAATSSAIIIGFNVRPNAKTKSKAEEEKVEIKTYSIIYDAIEDIEKALKGMLEPEFKEVSIGSVEVRQIYKITGVGTIAGSHVIDGKVQRAAKVHLTRDGVVVYEGAINSLKYMKDDVKELAKGYDCGIGLENFNDIKVGDIIECSVMEEVKRD